MRDGPTKLEKKLEAVIAQSETAPDVLDFVVKAGLPYHLGRATELICDGAKHHSREDIKEAIRYLNYYLYLPDDGRK